MARGSSMYTMIRRMQAEQRREEAARRRELREYERTRARLAREAKLDYTNRRIAETEELNIELEERLCELGSVLAEVQASEPDVLIEGLRDNRCFPEFVPDPELVKKLAEPNLDSFLGAVRRPFFLVAWLDSAKRKYWAALEAARSNWERSMAEYELSCLRQTQLLEEARHEYARKKGAFESEVQTNNERVESFERSYVDGVPDAVVSVMEMCLAESEYPEGFPDETRIAFVPESKQLVVERELPGPDIVPRVVEYRYVKSKDSIEEKPRKASEVKDLYQSLVAGVALRTLKEVFESETQGHVQAVVFNGMLQTVDPSTGRDIRPCLISVRATRERFQEIDLSRVDPKACLRNLGAQVSPHASEAQPVKPIIEFNMVDKRFVDQSDIMAELDCRPNLMELNPFEFEHLTANLFQTMGLETKLTRSSRDGGVDAVAYDSRPIIGGKVVIQAKRYRNTVGVSAVRDLFGTMNHEGANKGILVTTSGYGPDAYEFAKDKPIELIDGGGLLYLLEQAGIHARIVFPEDGD